LVLWKTEYLGPDPILDSTLFDSQARSRSGTESKTQKKMGSGSENNSFGSTTLSNSTGTNTISSLLITGTALKLRWQKNLVLNFYIVSKQTKCYQSINNACQKLPALGTLGPTWRVSLWCEFSSVSWVATSDWMTFRTCRRGMPSTPSHQGPGWSAATSSNVKNYKNKAKLTICEPKPHLTKLNFFFITLSSTSSTCLTNQQMTIKRDKNETKLKIWSNLTVVQ
jgi:hypothetical protein